MPLKYFHIVIMFFAILVDLGFCIWARMMPAAARIQKVGILGDFAGLLALGLTVYLIWYVVKKIKTLPNS
jgi:hypothetical protein